MKLGHAALVRSRTSLEQRRALLGQLLAAGGLALLPTYPGRAAGGMRFEADPFSLGVASGYPLADDVVLWTRLAPTPLAPGGGMSPEVVPVDWEVAADAQFRQIVRSGVTYAEPDWAHSVHVEPGGLDPGRPYWYRFRAGGAKSPVGRTATAPARGASPGRLRLAVASCQQYEHGYYTAYRHMVSDQPDLIVHLGDYIYELSWGETHVRAHGAPECYSLEDYRARYALYRSDPLLQAAHAACPWLITWDDHEVDNDYAADVSEEDDEPALFLARRAAAYRACYEHQPLPRRALPYGPYMRIHAQCAFGDLANIVMLDDRQYRSPQACPKPGRRGANRVSDCAELASPERSKLGARQEAWLAAHLAESKARWNLLAQGTVVAHVDEQPGPGERYWTDGWSGYPAARARLLAALEASRARNPICLSGDIHAFLAAKLNRVAADPDSPVVAAEFVTTSISSQGVPEKMIEERLGENPGLLAGTSRYRGYLRLDLYRDRAQADMVAIDSVLEPDSGSRVFASFSVEDGRPGPVRS
jgi:alkaline phosphatase D